MADKPSKQAEAVEAVETLEVSGVTVRTKREPLVIDIDTDRLRLKDLEALDALGNDATVEQLSDFVAKVYDGDVSELPIRAVRAIFRQITADMGMANSPN